MPIINSSSPSFETQPISVMVPLFEHQKRSLQAAINLEANPTISLGSTKTFVSNVGFLSDEPGSGAIPEHYRYLNTTDTCPKVICKYVNMLVLTNFLQASLSSFLLWQPVMKKNTSIITSPRGKRLASFMPMV